MSKQLSKHIRDKLERLLSNVGDMSLKRRARRIIEELDPKQNDDVVDLGCGTGYYLFLLSSLSVKLRLTGFDNDEGALKEAKTLLTSCHSERGRRPSVGIFTTQDCHVARRLAPRNDNCEVGKNIKFVPGDLHKMPFQDNSFDKAVASEVLEHVEDDGRVLKEIYRILKPNGVLVISVPSQNYPFLWDPLNWLLERFFHTHIKNGFFSGIWSGHLRLYSLPSLKRKFANVGFTVKEAEELTFWCLPFNHYIVNIIARLLYDIKISPKVADKISKFKITKKPLLIDLAFKFVNWVDKLNEIFPQKHGVNIFIKARKY